MRREHTGAILQVPIPGLACFDPPSVLATNIRVAWSLVTLVRSLEILKQFSRLGYPRSFTDVRTFTWTFDPTRIHYSSTNYSFKHYSSSKYSLIHYLTTQVSLSLNRGTL
jgi:hypothetical protein